MLLRLTWRMSSKTRRQATIKTDDNMTTTLELTEAELRSRVEALEYANDGQRITQPGKFEGEPIFAPHYWDIALQGFADSDDGNVFTFKFKAGDRDFVVWPELKQWLGRSRTLRMAEDSQGFVCCF
jgi:hypothetical protein